MKALLLSFGFLFSVFLGAQNLVPNFSFETYTACPTNYGQIDRATGWTSPVFGSTPDFVHACGTLHYGVPSNTFGSQYARTGNGYSGIVLVDRALSNDYREYIQIRLSQPLNANTCYQFEMFLSLGETYSRYSTDDVGVYFSNTPVSNMTITNGPMPFTPQILNPSGNYPDTASWKRSGGSFIASGGEEYMIIGNFSSGIPDTLIADSTVHWKSSYIYVDDVSLVACNLTEGVSTHADEQVSLYPGFFDTELTVTMPPGTEALLVISDLSGREVLARTARHKEIISTNHLNPGIYFYRLTLQNGNTSTGKITKY